MTAAEIIQIILGLLIIAGASYWLIAIYCVNLFFRPVAKEHEYQPLPVSILKPLKGRDPELARNIRSFCEQDYPDYELLLGLNRAGEAEVRETGKALEVISCGNARIVSSDLDLGENRKVSNLQGMLTESRGSLIVMSDSDMRVDKDYLKTIVGEYQSDSNIGMVTSLYKISDPKGMGTAFESMSIALDFLPSVLVAERLEGVSFGLGASMLFSRKALDDIGGFPSVADYLADDYQIGNRIFKKGFRVVISRYVVEDIAGHMSFSDYWVHQLRWARTVRASRPAGYFGSGVSHIIPFAIFLCLLGGINPISVSVLACALLLRFCMAGLVYRHVIRNTSWLKWIILLPVKDMFSFLIWIGAFTGSRVKWRGSLYEVQKDGKIIKLNCR